MRIAISHMRHAQAGGTERYLDQLAAYLAERGHAVTILCRTHERAPHPAVRFATFRGWALGGLARRQRFARAVERHLADHDYDVVYGLGRTWSQDVVRLGGGTIRTHVELVGSVERSRIARLIGRHRRADRWLAAVEARNLAPGGRQLVVCNAHMVAADVQRRYGTETERIRVIHNAVDAERFDRERHAAAGRALRARWGFAPEDRVVLFLGSNYVRKGLDRLMAAFAAIAADHPRARLAVVGYDRDPDAWRRRAVDLGIGARIHVAGGSRETEACYAAADCYALPTRYDPFANTTLEALASGLPVITTDGNGGHEVLTPESGSVVPATGPVAPLAAALAEWLAPERLAGGRIAARAVAEANGVAAAMARSEAVLVEAAARRATPSG